MFNLNFFTMSFLKTKKKRNCAPESPIKSAKKEKMKNKQFARRAHQEAANQKTPRKRKSIAA